MALGKRASNASEANVTSDAEEPRDPASGAGRASPQAEAVWIARASARTPRRCASRGLVNSTRPSRSPPDLERESRVAASVLAGGLAYKLFLWLLPFGLILGGVFGINNTNDIEDAIHSGGLVGAVINTIGDSTRATGFDPLVLLVVGVAGIVWAGRSGARSVQLVYALIWDEPPTGEGRSMRRWPSPASCARCWSWSGSAGGCATTRSSRAC